ncbi:hypothetical protein SSABA_v1c01150 [Spiroplasma sabaudiense Ar-1343]|uniref:Uncharacterized protein n=1 Tax=Spiroplasma sabaudiense Ar-1343 TaxID=1276257 RepID=W6A937_9MOLU|nr:MFS transporter [Spiroplasma sabaudiense]AHI53527.1 hypothetical protein SSABA_v1c01150 [Spiroplasma sabaudiense Ar-1343]
MKRQGLYKQAKTWSIVNIVVCSSIMGIFLLLGFIFFSSTPTSTGLESIALTTTLLITGTMTFMPIMVCSIITVIIVNRELKSGREEKHTALAICSIIFSGIFGIISGILILVADSESSAQGYSNEDSANVPSWKNNENKSENSEIDKMED